MKLQQLIEDRRLAVFGLALIFLALPAASAATAQEKIAFQTNRDGNTEVYVMDTDGSNQTRLTYSVDDDAYPAFSPDGSKIAFSSSRDGNYEIYVMNVDGTQQTRITRNAFADIEPAWSPDGSKIAFTSYRDGNTEIYVMNADGTNQLRLTNTPYIDQNPSFSPNGTEIIFQTSRDSNLEIYKMNANGSNQTNVSNTAGNDIEADYSPDGSKIVFRALRDGGMDVYTMNPDGSNQVCLTCNNPTFDNQPTFSSDGSKIAFRTDRDGGNREIYVMNADGSGQVNLTNAASDDSEPSWGAANSAPVLSNVAVSTAVDEGGTATLTGDIADSDSTDGFTLTVNWGDGSAPQIFTYAVGTNRFSETHVYEDDAPVGTPIDDFTVGLLLSDNRFGVDTGSAVVTVRNIAPSLTGLAVDPSTPGFGVPVALTGTYTDAGYSGSPGDEDLKVFVNWGDGQSGFLSTNGAPGSINEAHLYALPGSYTVTVKVTDNDAGETVRTLNVAAAPPPPPAAPAGFKVDNVGMNSIQLSWTDASNNEDGFAIEQCRSKGCTNFVEIARVNAGITVYNNTALLSNTQYYYRMRSFNLGGTSAYTNVISGKTLRR
jgi:Tol biopolymer transport system component